MLMNVLSVHEDQAPYQSSVPDILPVKIIRARSIAHGEFQPFELASMAAAWVDHRAVLIPTTELASDVFNVSRQLIGQDRKRNRPASLPLGMLAYGWAKSSPAERDAFCRQHEVGIWKALELVADCQRFERPSS